MEEVECNLPFVGEEQCDECGAPGGIHAGTCHTAWRMTLENATNDVDRARVKRMYRDVCANYGIVRQF